MNIGFWTCIAFFAIFLICALVFALLKEKAAILISGFLSLPPEQQKHYDRAAMSRDQRNAFLLWAGIFGVGALLCYFVSSWCVIPAVIVWLVVFFRDVHMDPYKAFQKYRRH